jgi:phosphate-selective porin OprO/OprP
VPKNSAAADRHVMLFAFGTDVLGRTSTIAFALLFVLGAGCAFAQQPASDQPDRERGDGWRVGWGDHPQIEWRALRLEFRGQLHAVEADSNGPIRGNESDAARRRFAIDGAIGRRLRFQAEAEIESDEPARDVYLDYRAARAAQIRGGRFKLPVGLEENISHAKLEFVRRSLMSDRLAPGRDEGLMVYGRVGRIGYETGVFAHDGANARPGRAVRVFAGPTIAGRVLIEPFRGAKTSAADLEIGASFTHGTVPEGYSAVRGKTVLGATFFGADFWVSGVRRRTGAELRWRPGPFAFMAEAITLTDERRGQSLDWSDLPPFVSRGWYISGSWVAAGAERASNVDKPRAPLFGGGWGSLQLAVRHESLMFGHLDVPDPPLVIHRATLIPGSQDMATTVGMTWHANRWVRVQANMVRERLRGALSEPAPPSALWNRLVHFQVVF